MIWLLRPLIYVLLFAGVFCLPVVAQPWLDPLKQPILPESDRRSMMFSYVDRQLRALEIPGTLPDWIAHRTRLSDRNSRAGRIAGPRSARAGALVRQRTA